MLTISSPRRITCGQVARRPLIQAAGAGLLGLTLPGLLGAEAAAAQLPSTGSRRARSVIFLFLFGGPSQLETFDLKPDAPSSVRGPFHPIPCRTDGLLVSESLPRLAALSHRYCIIRTMTHDFNDHSGGGHYIQTGHRWHVPIGGGFSPTPRDWPSVGSVLSYAGERGLTPMPRDVPGYAVLPNSLGHLQEAGQYPRPGEHAGWLGRAYNPFTTAVQKRSLTDNPYWRDCADAELTFQTQQQSSTDEIRLDRLNRRRRLLDRFDDLRGRIENSPTVAAQAGFRRRALDLVCSSRTRDALDIGCELPATRDRYGRHLFGQSCLMARRLVEAGTRFVTVHYDCCDGYSWDSHVHSDDVKQRLMPTTDQAVAALIEDLHDRGLLDETLVVMLGEMGRTPRANGRWGRDHWSTLFPALLAGGGVRGGTCHGTSDAEAAYPVEGAVTPEDLAATLYHSLGLPPDLAVPDLEGRPTRLIDGGRPLTGIFG